jgi:two-component system, sporulation sensor kinase A
LGSGVFILNETSLFDLKLFETAFLHAPIGMTLVSLDGYFLKVNPALCKMLEYSEEELKQQTFQSLTYIDDLENNLAYTQKALAGEIDSYQFEKRYTTKSGKTIWTILSAAIVRNKLGIPQFFISQLVDITEQKIKEEELKQIEELHQLISEHSQDIIIRCTPEGMIRYISPSVCYLLGYQPEELIGKYCFDFWHPEDLEHWVNQDSHDYRLIIYRARHKNGGYVWFEAQCKMVRSALGDVEQLIASSRDITERKKAESLLQESEQRHKSLVKYTPAGIFAIDFTGTFFEVSPSYEEMTGYSSKELLSMTFRDVIHPEMLAWGEQNHEKAIKGELPHVELALQHKNGSRIEVIASSSPIFIDGETVGIYVITKDITQQKRTEELLQKTEKLSLVGELAAGIAHEIRNPLTSLRGFVQLFQKEDASGARRLYYEVMLSEIDRINEITSEFLVLAKPTNETFSLSSIAKKLDHVITLFEGQAHLYNIEINKDFDESLPMVHSQSSLKQVFINILKNAFESMPNGGAVLVQAKRMDKGVCIRFRDQGCGIPSDQLAKIGTPFYTTKETGTGLGMMVSQRIVQNHKGMMQIESEVGKGTTVEVILPMGPTGSTII